MSACTAQKTVLLIGAWGSPWRRSIWHAAEKYPEWLEGAQARLTIEEYTGQSGALVKGRITP